MASRGLLGGLGLNKSTLLLLHYPILAGMLTGYYLFVNPPSTATSTLYMFGELSVLLFVFDTITHKYIVGVD